jgi:hyaluronan synthase
MPGTDDTPPWKYPNSHKKRRNARIRKAHRSDRLHGSNNDNFPVRAVLPVHIPLQEAIPGALKKSYPVPSVRFRYGPVWFLPLCTILIAAAIAWRLSAGLTNLERASLFAVIPLFMLRAAGWVMSCWDRPVEVIDDYDRGLLDRLYVVVSVPCFNENKYLLDRCLYALINQTRPPDRIDIIDDGSTKEDYEELQRYWNATFTQDKRTTEIFWKRQVNMGKRRAHCATFTSAPLADIFITVDSDTTLCPNAVEEGLKPFLNPEVMSVAGIELGYNASHNFLTMLQNSLQQIAQAVVSAAWSVTGKMFTNRGPFALYRSSLIAEMVPLYWGETFFGHRVILGDDSLLAMAGSMYGKSVQQLSAFGLTMWPETLGHHIRQRLRWARGRTVRNFWRLKYYPVTSYIWWFTTASIYSFITGLAALILLAISWPSSEHLVLRILTALILLSWLSQLRVLCFKRSDESWLDRFLVIAIRPAASLWASIVLTRIVRAWGMSTCLKQGWTTRQDGAELVLEPGLEQELVMTAEKEFAS